MIVTRTPLRINYAAGGTDLPAYYDISTSPGAVIGATIDKYIHVIVKPNYEGTIRLHYRDTETRQTTGAIRNERVRACLEHFGIEGGIEIASLADVPGSSGLGSSGAFMVGLVYALAAYVSGDQYSLTPYQVAELAFRLENQLTPVGKQDPYFAATGGHLLFEFHTGGLVTAEQVFPTDDWRRHLLLLDTGIRRDASTILSRQVRTFDDTAPHAAEIVRSAYTFAKWFPEGRVQECGELLDYVWGLKKQLAPGITTPGIDHLYNQARAAGAWGGKIVGAGGGGFLLLAAPPRKHNAILNATRLRQLPFAFVPEGAEVLYMYM